MPLPGLTLARREERATFLVSVDLSKMRGLQQRGVEECGWDDTKHILFARPCGRHFNM